MRMLRNLSYRLWAPALLLLNAGLIAAYNTQMGNLMRNSANGELCLPGQENCLPVPVNIYSQRMSGCNQDSQILEIIRQFIMSIGLPQALHWDSGFATYEFTGTLADGRLFSVNHLDGYGNGESINVESIVGSCLPAKFEL